MTLCHVLLMAIRLGKYINGLLILVKACVEPATLFGWADNWRMEYYSAIDFLSNTNHLSFSLTSCLIKAREPSLSYYLPIIKRKREGFMPMSFPRAFMQSEIHSCPGFDLNLSCLFPMIITNIPQMLSWMTHGRNYVKKK